LRLPLVVDSVASKPSKATEDRRSGDKNLGGIGLEVWSWT